MKGFISQIVLIAEHSHQSLGSGSVLDFLSAVPLCSLCAAAAPGCRAHHGSHL